MFCIFIGFNKKKMVGVKIPRVGVKITRGSLTPGGQAAQGVKINCFMMRLNYDKVADIHILSSVI